MIAELVDDPFLSSARISPNFLSERVPLSEPTPVISGWATDANNESRMFFLFPEEPGQTPGISVSPTSGLVTDEAGGTVTFDVSLAWEPTADVTIALSSSDTSEGTVNPASVTFTPANWDTPQTVTVTGVDDADTDRNVNYSIVTAAATSTDPDFDGLDPTGGGQLQAYLDLTPDLKNVPMDVFWNARVPIRSILSASIARWARRAKNINNSLRLPTMCQTDCEWRNASAKMIRLPLGPPVGKHSNV